MAFELEKLLRNSSTDSNRRIMDLKGHNQTILGAMTWIWVEKKFGRDGSFVALIG